jgi:hypothetical protein
LVDQQVKVKPKPWTYDEDTVLLNAIEVSQSNGDINWNKVAEKVYGRMPQVCKARFYTLSKNKSGNV